MRAQQIPAKQMLAAIGQPRLMEIYAQVFRIYGISVAQVLLTRADLCNGGEDILMPGIP